MKKGILLALIIFPLLCSADWTPYSPTGIIANKICYGVYNSNDLICTPAGFYLHDGPGGSWDFYTYGELPVWDASYVNNNHFLVVMGDGTYSDGIHYFNTQSHEFEFEMVEWLYKPNFVHFSYQAPTWFVGHEYGLVFSTNGFDWVNIPFLENKKCMMMKEYQDMMVLLTDEWDNNLYISQDNGETWTRIPLGFKMVDIDFTTYGELWGIFPGFSNSSGLYSSDDGFTWSNELYIDGVTCLKAEVTGNIVLGWKEPAGIYEGVYMFNPESGELKNINQNLPNRSVNMISYNPWMTIIHLFCCTDDGVYWSFDYMTGIDENDHDAVLATVNNYPDPFTGQTIIEYELKKHTDQPLILSIYDLTGNKVDEISGLSGESEKHQFIYHPSFLESGIYFYQLTFGDQKFSDKMILAR